jgi:hypothetical protein
MAADSESKSDEVIDSRRLQSPVFRRSHVLIFSVNILTSPSNSMSAGPIGHRYHLVKASEAHSYRRLQEGIVASMGEAVSGRVTDRE